MKQGFYGLSCTKKQYFLKCLTVPVPYFQSMNLVYLHAAPYNKNCHGITQIHSYSEGKLQETPEVSSSTVTYLPPCQIQNLTEIRAAFLGREEWCLESQHVLKISLKDTSK